MLYRALLHLFVFAVALIAPGIAPDNPPNAYKVRVLDYAADLFKIIPLEKPSWTHTELWNYLKDVNDVEIQRCWKKVKENKMNVVIYHPVRGIASLKLATLSDQETVNMEGVEIFLDVVDKHWLGVMYEGGNVILDHLGFYNPQISTRTLWKGIKRKSEDGNIVQNLLTNIKSATVKYSENVNKSPVSTVGDGDKETKIKPVQEATLYVRSDAADEADVTHRVPMWTMKKDHHSKAPFEYKGVFKFTKSPTNRKSIWNTLKRLLDASADEKLTEIHIEMERESNVVISDDNNNNTEDNVDVSKATDLIYTMTLAVSIAIEKERKQVKVIPPQQERVVVRMRAGGKQEQVRMRM